MADITLSSGSICEPHRSAWGGFPTRSFGVSTGVSSAAIYVGSIMTMDNDDVVAQTSNASQVQASTGTAAAALFYLAGISAQAVSGSTAVRDTACTVWECHPDVEFRAATKGGTLESSHVCMTKKLTWDSTLNIAYVQLGASTAAEHRVLITGLIDAIGDSGGYVSFRFLRGLTGNIQGTTSTYNSSTPLLAFYR